MKKNDVEIENIYISADDTHHLYSRKPFYDNRFTRVMSYHSPGIAAVEDENGGYHIDLLGNPLYEKRFQKTFGFYTGIAAVVDDSGWYHIDLKGNPVYNERYAWVGNFQEGRCPVRDSDGMYFHITKGGIRAYLENYLYAGDFKYGIAVVYTNKGIARYIDRDGNHLHEHRFRELGVYHKGFAIARDETGYFHIDKKGRPIYEERYEWVEPFYNTLAFARTQEGDLIVIDESGKQTMMIRKAKSEQQSPSRETIMELLVGYWKTQIVHSLVKSRILDTIGSGENTFDALINAIDLPNRSIKMLLKTGGGDPRHGPVQGFHWHMEGVNDVDYITTDDRRLEIPWVRMTDQNGKVTVFQTTDEDKRLTKEQIASMSKRRMDCMDCHNRPTHTFLSPNEALDMAMLSGKIDPAIPEIKSTAGSLLEGKYETEGEALAAIDGSLRKKCEGAPNLDSAIEEVQRIYQRNFFPEMKVRWDAYPDHSGHKITPGCFRCHDGQHVSESGEVIRRDCEICHVIIAQGPGTEPDGFTPHGLEFEHPEDIDDEWKTERCDTCHTGAP